MNLPAQDLSRASDGTWTEISSERGYFSLANSQYVRFGAGTKWVGKYVSGTVPCVKATFGANPAPGVAKVCELYTAAVSLAAAPAQAR